MSSHAELASMLGCAEINMRAGRISFGRIGRGSQALIEVFVIGNTYYD